MEIQTKFHGVLDINENYIIDFKYGIPGFEQETKFIILELFEGSAYKVLQSIQHSYVAFIMVDPWMFESSYEFDLKESVIEELQIKTPQQLEIYSIMTISNDFSKSTINLLAPIIIHRDENMGMQFVLEGTSYTTKYPIRTEG